MKKSIKKKSIKKKILKGDKAAPGIARGKVWKIKSPKVPRRAKRGYIVVANYITPVVALKILTSKAIVTEKGGLHSHAAIVSREFGIPCVVAVKNVLKQVKENQKVEVDADRGEIIY